MFSTILERATGYFDRNALVSAFFPNLIYWALTIIVILTVQMGWNTSLKAWNGLGITVQILLLVAFIAWVTFCSFLTLNFRASLMRFYEGYWTRGSFADRMAKWRQRYWQKQWDQLDKEDRSLEEQEIILQAEKRAFEEIQSALAQSDDASKQISSPGAEQPQQELETLLQKLEEELVVLETGSLSVTMLQKVGEEVRAQWAKMIPWLTVAEKNDTSLVGQYRQRLQRAILRLQELGERYFDDVQGRRQSLYYDLSLYYPTKRSEIMPTRLGNVLKAAEMYSSTRYHLDAVLIWSRLQATLPSEFLTAFQDAKTSLDLMATVSAFTLLFGLPLSLWVAIIIPTSWLWWVLLIGTEFILSWLSYQTAIKAGLNYGEKIKAAFDLYRWKVLDDLHLQLPTNLQEERRIWEEVCGLLARGYEPDPHYYCYAQQERTKDSKESSAS